MRYLAVCLVLRGRVREAHEVVKRLLTIAPQLTIRRLRNYLELDSPSQSKMLELLDDYCEALRKAGLPE
jgi:hypothetical protein